MRMKPTKPLPVTSNNIAFKVLQQLMARMFEPEERRLQATLDRIIEQQEEINPTAMFAVMHGGVTYSHSRYGARQTTRSLSYVLWDQMEKFLNDQKEVLQDKELIQQTLFKCVFNWRDGQDFRNRMPEAVVPLLSDGMQQLPRTVPFEEATCLKERDRRQFEKILPKIELYTVARMIY